MELGHRLAIIRNIPKLINVKKFQQVCTKLVDAGVYSKTMIENVLAGAGEVAVERYLAQRLFLNVVTRGPDAFHHLVEALKESGDKELANDLLYGVSKSEAFKEEKTEICWAPEDEVDSSNSNFSDSQLIMLQKSQKAVEKKTVSESLPSIIEEVEIKVGEVTETSPLEIEELSGNMNPRFVTVPVQLMHSTNYIVKPASVRYNGFANEGECYHMKSKPRGFALIVNNIDFLGDPDEKRLGAESDSVNFKSVLEQMGYEVTVSTNVTKKELLDRECGTLAKFINSFHSKDVDSCIVSINSHGFDRDWIRMSDPPGRSEKSTAIDLVEDIFQRFNNRHFSIFQGRPKIFLINACRGSNFNRVVQSPLVENTRRAQSDGLPTVRSGSEFSDFLILRSTVPEYVSMRDLDKGTWFIQCICKSFSSFACDEEFHGLKRKVNHLMEELIDEESQVKQSCHYEEFGTNKLLYFNPGL